MAAGAYAGRFRKLLAGEISEGELAGAKIQRGAVKVEMFMISANHQSA